MIQNILENFPSPAPRFQGAPFRAWNSRLEKEELCRQIEVMHKMCLRGFFMHARVGRSSSRPAGRGKNSWPRA